MLAPNEAVICGPSPCHSLPLLMRILCGGYRLDLCRILASADGECSVQEMAAATCLPQSYVSKDLKGLRAAGLVRMRKQGSHHFYRLTPCVRIEADGDSTRVSIATLNGDRMALHLSAEATARGGAGQPSFAQDPWRLHVAGI
jgi:DNA-binding transcriptional ArsR family regulator